ncbi:hypothetical protein ACFE04_020941 [Oxalis oulophora]
MKLDLTPSSASFETLVTYCSQCGKVHQALDLVDEMREPGLTLTLDRMDAILNASANFEFNLFKGAYRMLKTMKEMKLNPNSSVYNTIMARYFKEKNVKGALMVLEKMKLTGTQPDSITYSYLILNSDCERDIVKSVLASSLAIRGQFSDAVEIYEEIKLDGLKLEPKAAINVIDLEGDPEYWVDGCWRTMLYCVRFKHLSITIDLLTRMKDFYSNDEIALEFLFDEAFSLIAEMGNTHF